MSSDAPAASKKVKASKPSKTASSGGSKGFYPRKEAKAASPKFKAVYKAVTPELQSLVDQVIDPDSTGEAVRWPLTYGLSAVYKSINTIDARFDQYGQSAVVVYPRLANSILTTAGLDYSQALTVSGTPAGNYLSQRLVLNTMMSVYPITDIWYFADSQCVLPRSNGTGRFLYPIGWNSADATPLVNFQFPNISSGDAGALTLTTRWYDASGVELHNSVASVPANGLVSQTLNPVAATNITFWMSFEVSITTSVGYQGLVTAQFRETGPAPLFEVTLFNQANHFIVQDLNGANTITSSSEEYFVSAQSLLCTYTGSDLQNGGLIATARIPGDTVLGQKTDVVSTSIPQGNPYYDWIASLATNRYDGPIKDGSYAFYLGQSEDSYFYRPVEDSFTQDSNYLVAAFNTTDPGAQNLLRIKVISHVQFTSNNNIYSQSPSPYMRDVKLMQHVLSLIPAAYCNPLHKAQIKEHLKKIGSRVGRILTNPDNWMSAAKIAAKLLL